MSELLPCPLLPATLQRQPPSSSRSSSSALDCVVSISAEDDFADVDLLTDYPDLLLALRRAFGGKEGEEEEESPPSPTPPSDASSTASTTLV